MRKIIFACLVLLLSTIYYEQGFATETLDLCTLDENIQTYREHRVRVSAFINESYESAVLYDPKCQDGKPLVHFVLKSNINGKIKLLRKIVTERGYAFVTVEGIVHGPEPIQIDPQLADKIKELYKVTATIGYGQLNEPRRVFRRLYNVREDRAYGKQEAVFTGSKGTGSTAVTRSSGRVRIAMAGTEFNID